MLARLNLPMTPEAATGLGLPASLLTAASAATPRPLRLAAAEKAFRAGVLPVPLLADILDLSTFTPAGTRWGAGAGAGRTLDECTRAYPRGSEDRKQ